MSLAELQRYFASAATSGSGALPDLDRVFTSSERLPARERLAIYNRAYFYRLLDALASVFEQTKRVLGDSEFERLGLSYVAQHPSMHPAVERIGRSFPEYLQSVATPGFVVDLAALEWARLCALVAGNPPSIAQLAAIEPSRFPHARLRFVPSLYVLELDPHALSAFAGVVSALPAGQPSARCGVAVWRSQHAVHHQSLEAAEWQALASALSGATLSRVCTAFDRGSPDEDVRRAFQVLSGWFARQWLESIVYQQATPETSG